MYKATRDFIRDRQPHARFVVQQVNVRQAGGGAPGEAYANAHAQIDRARNIKLVSGWLVKPYDKALRQTEIALHWWNIDATTRSYFDTTPALPSGCEYVADMSLLEYGLQHFDDVPANVCQAVLRGEAGYTMVDRIFGELFYKPIPTLDTSLLFKRPG